MKYKDEYDQHTSKLNRLTQAKLVWNRFLRDQSKFLIHKSRRKQLGSKPRGGSMVDERDKPDRRTDKDEIGYVDFWGTT